MDEFFFVLQYLACSSELRATAKMNKTINTHFLSLLSFFFFLILLLVFHSIIIISCELVS